MKTIYNLEENESKTTLFQKTCKNHIWGRLKKNIHIGFNPTKDIEYDQHQLIGTDEWWKAVQEGKILSNEYVGIIKFVHPRDNHVSMRTKNEELERHWTFDFNSTCIDSIDKMIRIKYIYCLSVYPPSESSLHKFPVLVQIEE